ncbi:hypothetical protein [Magnetovibrio sp.]|uniref:hypothetical protein n=1 Tax=Magnetovibrio sp. TaxID=2024836 RepID=UPI002F95FD63
MSTVYGDIRLRPTRVGLLVNPSDKQSIMQFVRYCACLWGGQFNPIIPVSDRLPTKWKEGVFSLRGRDLAQGYLRYFEPDVLVEAVPGMAAKLGYAATKTSFTNLIVPLDKFITQNHHGEFDFRCSLNIFDYYRHLYSEMFQFVRKDGQPFVEFVKGGKYSNSLEVLFGGFPEVSGLQFVEQGYRDVFEPITLKADAQSALKVYREKLATPFSITKHDLELDYSDNWRPLVFIFDGRNSLDLIDAWNIRLFKRDVVAIDVRWFDAFENYLVDFIKKNHRPLPGNPNKVMVHSTIEFGRSIPENIVDELSQKIRDGVGTEGWAKKLWYDSIWSQPDDEDLAPQSQKVRITSKSSSHEALVSKSDRSTKFESLAPDFAERYGADARWVNVLSFSSYSQEIDIALAMPSNHKTPDFPRLNSGGEAALVSREGWVFFQQYKNSQVYISFLSGEELISGWFKENGIKTRPSYEGRIANQAIKKIHSLHDASVFADADTIKILNTSAMSIRHKSGAENGQEQQFRATGVQAQKFKNLLKARSRRGHFDTIKLSHLTDMNIVRLGLSVPCSHCDHDNWYSLEGIGYSLPCELCLNEFSFPQGDFEFSKSPWHFRPVGPFAEPDYARGAYSTILSLRVFSRLLSLGGRAKLAYCTGVHLQLPNKEREIDFVAFYQRSRMFNEAGEVQYIFGEAKSFASPCLKDADLDTLKALGERFPGSFLVVSTLNPEFNLDDQKRLIELALWGREPGPLGEPRASLIVFTGNELFANWSLKKAWEDLGGTHAKLVEHSSVQLSNLRNLSDFTQQLYLGLPSYHAWLGEYYAKNR